MKKPRDEPVGPPGETPGAASFVIRPLRPEDVASLAAGCLASVPAEEVAERVADDLRRHDEGTGLTLVAECRGCVASVLNVTWDGPEAWIHNVVTAPPFRGMGLVPRMIERLAPGLRDRGVRRLNAHVLAGNLSARRAYEKAGLQPQRAEGMRGEQWRYARDL